ncbi:hypothetical protein KM043_008157 [Ampulex compressa]|nr:hypothetical protein KM043_008157 [Ampulex compressa]
MPAGPRRQADETQPRGRGSGNYFGKNEEKDPGTFSDRGYPGLRSVSLSQGRDKALSLESNLIQSRSSAYKYSPTDNTIGATSNNCFNATSR